MVSTNLKWEISVEEFTETTNWVEFTAKTFFGLIFYLETKARELVECSNIVTVRKR